MTQEIEQITDFSAIEDAVELWAGTASGLPVVKDRKKFYWEGFDFGRKRPYGTLNIVSDLTQGQPWQRQATIIESLITKIKTTYYQPFVWNVQIAIYTDAYDENRNSIRQTARFYAKQLINRAYLTPIKSILGALDIAFMPLNQNVRGNIQNSDEDKYIHQAIMEYRFTGIAETALKDSDWFSRVKTPEMTLNEANTIITIPEGA